MGYDGSVCEGSLNIVSQRPVRRVDQKCRHWSLNSNYSKFDSQMVKNYVFDHKTTS